MKTSELTGKALDWAVTKCEEPCGGYKPWVQADLDKGVIHGMNYSTDWLWGGPIIERERIQLTTDSLWIASSPKAVFSSRKEANKYIKDRANPNLWYVRKAQNMTKDIDK